MARPKLPAPYFTARIAIGGRLGVVGKAENNDTAPSAVELSSKDVPTGLIGSFELALETSLGIRRGLSHEV